MTDEKEEELTVKEAVEMLLLSVDATLTSATQVDTTKFTYAMNTLLTCKMLVIEVIKREGWS